MSLSFILRRLNFAIGLALLLNSCAIPDAPPDEILAPRSFQGTAGTRAMIYTGPGSWSPEIEALSNIFVSKSVSYEHIDAARLDSMSLDEIASFQLMIFPGGDSPTVTRNLKPETHARLRSAVRERGTNYLGFCAGAWLAVSPTPPTPDIPSVFGLAIVDGPVLERASLEKEGKKYALAKAKLAGGEREMLWFGGPITPDSPGAVVARYPDGTPAISQLRAGNGYVVISGFHPAITNATLGYLGLSSAEAHAPEIAWQLIEAAVTQRPLPSI